MSDVTDILQDHENILIDWFKNDSDSAKKRNLEILKNLEKAKAKLLSQAIYSPTEQARAAAIQRYKLEPSLIPKN